MFSVFVTNKISIIVILIILIFIIIIIVYVRVVPVKLKSFVSCEVIKNRREGKKREKNKELRGNRHKNSQKCS